MSGYEWAVLGVNHECGNAIQGNGPPITNPRPRASKHTEVPF